MKRIVKSGLQHGFRDGWEAKLITKLAMLMVSILR